MESHCVAQQDYAAIKPWRLRVSDALAPPLDRSDRSDEAAQCSCCIAFESVDVIMVCQQRLLSLALYVARRLTAMSAFRLSFLFRLGMSHSVLRFPPVWRLQ